jgi:FkbM family methyltransferase
MQDQIAERGFLERAKRAIQNPSRAAFALWARWFPHMPVPLRLSFGAWWVLRNDAMGNLIRQGNFEPAEISFVSRFLKPGMMVLDVGAHHGMYSLLASKRVGPLGKVFAFEPSPRERKALILHLRLNSCNNVSVQPLAVGERNYSTEFFVADANDAGCNSLRHPGIDTGLTQIAVQVARLDDWILEQKIGGVDFIKLDVEGGELSVLRGATKLLSGGLRPVILAEVQDVRTLQWGYQAKEIISFLSQRGYQWFALSLDGSLNRMDAAGQQFEGNYVAWPEECDTEQLARFARR